MVNDVIIGSIPRAEATNFRDTLQDQDQELQILDVGKRGEEVPFQIVRRGLPAAQRLLLGRRVLLTPLLHTC